MNSYSLKPASGVAEKLIERLIERATEIDNRLGPIPGSVADRLVRELREAADNLTTATDMSVQYEQIAVGGNHLANFLIEKLGGDFATKYPPDMDTESALRMLCATPEFDVWCCWAAIMRARPIFAGAQS